MAAMAMVGVVDQDDVARPQVAFELVQNVFDRKLAPHVLNRKADRNRDGASGCVPNPDGEIVELSDQVVLAGAVEDVPHFPADVLERMPDGRKREGGDVRGAHAAFLRTRSGTTSSSTMQS